MKKIIFTFSLLISSYSFSQSGMYIVTEKWDNVIGSIPTFDSIYVTSPSGTTIGYSISNLMLNTSGHDNEIHGILNPIISQGYKLVNEYMTSQNNANLIPQIAEYHIYWFAQPWTTAGLIPAGVNNSQIQILGIYPNPTADVVNVKFATCLQNSKLFLINSKGYIIDDFDISDLTEFPFNTSSLISGTYELILVSDGYYSESKTLLKQ